MTEKVFVRLNIGCALFFTVAFCFLVVPPLIQDFNIVGAFAAGFVNPYSSGYSTDVIVCWLILMIWVRYEAVTHKIRYGWICVVLGLVPGVAVGFALYLVLRSSQLKGKPA